MLLCKKKRFSGTTDKSCGLRRPGGATCTQPRAERNETEGRMKRHPGYNAAHYYRPGGAKACAKGNACRQGPNAIKSICPSGVAPRLTLLPLQGVLLGLEPNPGCRSRKTYGFQSLCPGLCARCPCRVPQLTSCPSVEDTPARQQKSELFHCSRLLIPFRASLHRVCRLSPRTLGWRFIERFR